MKTSDLYPTTFAKAVAMKVGLYDGKVDFGLGRDYLNMDNDDAENLFDALLEFQQLVIGGCEFEDAMLAYHGLELSEEQLLALRLIERSTKPWLLGHLAATLSQKVQDSDGKDFTQAAQILIEDLLGAGESGVETSKAKSLLIKLAKD